MSFVRTAAAAALTGAVGIKVLDHQLKLNLGSDFALGKRLVKAITVMKYAKRTDDLTVADVWADTVNTHGDNTFVIFEHRRYTYADMDMMSNRMANWLLEQGFKRGDVIALVMENKAEFIAWWLAMTKIGVQVAMINYSIKSKGLLHCINVAKSVGVLFDSDTEGNIYDIEQGLAGVKLLYWGGSPRKPFNVQPLYVTSDGLLACSRDASKFKEMRKGLKMLDNFGFIYTSGTTGLPKAANIMHAKFLAMGSMLPASGLGPADRFYTCLPLFHTAGGGIGACGCILTGATLVLSKKFSNTRFWNEIMAYDCTAFQYIGELGRYLVNYAKEHPEVTKLNHKIRFAVGNGLRPEVWDDFQDGFRIPLVAELYGSTEGIGVLVNFCERADKGARGAVGRAGFLMNKVLNARIVKFDVETEEVVRGTDGLCLEAAMGEAGELVFPNVKGDPSKTFKGYTDPKASAKKLTSDVFAKGDSWFRSGDLLSRDASGYFYFVDRIGDTFRWKGENCSTMEISEIVSSYPGVQEANAYGVKVPGSMDGRACCVAINGAPTLQERQHLDALQKLCEKELPKYAQPLFLRFLPDMAVTDTFKHQKVALREQGIDLNRCSDPVVWLSPASKRYEAFGAAEHQQLEHGASKL